MPSDAPTFPIEIEPAALEQLRRLVARRAGEGAFVRIGVKGGGCSGFEYVLKLDTRRTPLDLETTIEGILFVWDTKSERLLSGSRLVYTGNLIGGGFAFENPNAARSCGCGTSFMPKD